MPDYRETKLPTSKELEEWIEEHRDPNYKQRDWRGRFVKK